MNNVVKAICVVIASLCFLTPCFSSENVLNGSVTKGENNVTIPDAVVKVMEVQTQEIFMSEPTDDQGNFTIEGIPDGTYKMGVSTREGDFLLEDIVTLAQAQTSTTPISINLSRYAATQADMSSDPAAPEGLVSLRFFWHDDGSPLQGAKVYLKNLTTQKIYKGSKTDSNGCSFTTQKTEKIPAGEYEVLIKYKGTKFLAPKTIMATQKTGTFIFSSCFEVREPENTLAVFDRSDCECDLAGYLFTPFYKTPVGIATIAGGAAAVGITIYVWPTPKPSSPSNP